MATASKPRQSLKRKSTASSPPTTALEQAESLLPGSCTPGYVPPSPPLPSEDKVEGVALTRKSRGKAGVEEGVAPGAGGGKLNEDEKAALLVEILGFQPTELLQDITESARQQVDKTVLTIENWLSKVVKLSAAVGVSVGDGGGAALGKGKGKGKSSKAAAAAGTVGEEEMMLEVDQGLHGLETLLNDHMDTALDKLTSWALRNTFEIPDELRLTLPWHDGLDFDRGAYAAGLPEGEIAVQKNIEELREQVENMRKLNHGLTLADRTVGEKVKALQRQKEAIGFITTLAKDAGVTSLPDTAREITSQMDTLYNTLSTEFETVVPLPSRPSNHSDPFSTSSSTTGGTGSAGATSGTSGGGGGAGGTFTREWEFGRAAYLSWAVSRARALVNDPSKHGAAGGSGGMDVDRDDGADDDDERPTMTATTTMGIAGKDGEQKRLEELLAITRGVSGGVRAAGGAGGLPTTTGPADGVKGMGWALHGLLKNDAAASGGGGAEGAGGSG
ncbi:hypothetical protein QFC21_002000 [Naganishia friedmannii]|uniref:Uncharacterized protein n=1 Tax=Naganishia friedmannii TaxID=89922 RepID=A0ACC2VZU1_9TREE|nr:hypothetical protein QFC21_002000 [Naganishia friedmannii]